jgi:hypothetical protein
MQCSSGHSKTIEWPVLSKQECGIRCRRKQFANSSNTEYPPNVVCSKGSSGLGLKRRWVCIPDPNLGRRHLKGPRVTIGEECPESARYSRIPALSAAAAGVRSPKKGWVGRPPGGMSIGDGKFAVALSARPPLNAYLWTRGGHMRRLKTPPSECRVYFLDFVSVTDAK